MILKSFMICLVKLFSVGSDEEKNGDSDFSSHVWIPLRLLLSGSSGSRKSRSGEGVVGHDGWFSFDIINIVYFGSFVNTSCTSLATVTTAFLK